MELKALEIENFLSVGNIKLDLSGRGLVLIKGENKDDASFDNNGAGKSTIIEAVVYALYGRTLRGLKGDEVVHKKANKNCRVSMVIEDDDGKVYSVTRFRKHKEGKNEVRIMRGKTQLTQASIRNSDEFIVNLLQMDYLTFISSILYSQASFRFTSATDAEMKSAFDTMLDLGLLEACKEEAKRRYGAESGHLSSVEGKRRTVETMIEQLSTQRIQSVEDSEGWAEKNKVAIQTTKADAKKWVAESKKLKKEHIEKSKEISNYTKEVDVILAQINSVEAQVNIANAAKDTVKTCKANVDRLSKAILQLDSENQRINVRLEKTDSKLETIAKQLEDLTKKVGTPCPVCDRPLNAKHMSAARKELEAKRREIEQEIESDEKVITENNDSITQYAKDLAEAKKELKKAVTDAESAEEVIDQQEELETTYKVMKRKLDTMEREALEIFKNSAGAEASERGKLEQLKDLEAAENPHEATVKRLFDQIEVKRKELEKFDTDIIASQEMLRQLDEWVNGYGNAGIKSYLLDSVTPYLNRRINHYLSRLSADQIVEFSTQTRLKDGQTREKFSLSVLNANGSELYNGNSGGERKRVDLAVNLALQDLISSRGTKKLNIAFYDEVFDALDETGCENVIELLREVSSSRNSIFVISHNRTLTSHFDNSITVRKKGGYSTLVG